MPAYLIVLRESPIRDAEALAEYQRRSREMTGDFKLKPLIVYGATQALQGAAPDGVVMLEFPNVDEARSWYNSDAYQAILPYRLKSADHRDFIIDGFGVPQKA
jgi:uncharacterized protein (DUF1330 family)